jgi:hypothetical protein
MIEGSLDIKDIPRREVIKYTVKRGSIYTQIKQYNKKGKLEREIWERKSFEGEIILNDAFYISKESFERLIDKNFSSSNIIKIARTEDYKELRGLIVLLYRKKIYFSSEVIKIEPPLEEEFSIDA